MASNPIKNITPLGFPWETSDPFLFCVHHEDFYPAGDENMAPTTSLEGRNLGNDFAVKDGFRMYHGHNVPGFPAHPHRGFETVTIARKGLIDHSDSLGAAGRFGHGDVQWMTAGKGVQHSEMFPLLNQDEENTVELFQIWLNLPKSQKMVTPHFKMLWNDSIPVHTHVDGAGKLTKINVIAGTIGDTVAPAPAPNSWAANSENEVAIWTIKMSPNSVWTMPVASNEANRTLYFFKGNVCSVANQKVENYKAVQLWANEIVTIENGSEEGHFLMLQGKPINESVVQYGPFVMNTEAEIQETYMDYQQNQFGGWPWPKSDNVHAREKGRFALYADGSEELKD